MTITYINQQIKCDTVLCNKLATVKIDSNSYKGDCFLCKDCLTKLKNIFKKDSKK